MLVSSLSELRHMQRLDQRLWVHLRSTVHRCVWCTWSKQCQLSNMGLMLCGLFQVSTVRYIRTPVWSSGARMEDTVRVEGETHPVCVHKDIWVNITVCLCLYDHVTLADFQITFYNINTSYIGIFSLLEATDPKTWSSLCKG